MSWRVNGNKLTLTSGVRPCIVWFPKDESLPSGIAMRVVSSDKCGF